MYKFQNKYEGSMLCLYCDVAMTHSNVNFATINLTLFTLSESFFNVQKVVCYVFIVMLQ